MLILTNDDVARVLRMPDCIAAVREALCDLEEGRAVERPRSHAYTPLAEDEYYLFKSMEGGLKRYGVHALRFSSDRVREVEVPEGLRRDKLPLGPGGRYLGMILLFSMDNLEPVAAIQDGHLQRVRVGATSAIAALTLAGPGVTEAGLIGTGGQARTQLLGLANVFPGLRRVVVYSPNPDHRIAFRDEMAPRVSCRIELADTPDAAARDLPVVALATTAVQPVLQAEWLLPNAHVNSLQGAELAPEVLSRAVRVVTLTRDRPSHWAPAGGFLPRDVARAVRGDPLMRAKEVTLGELLVGRAPALAAEGVTVFGGGSSGGLGVQFAATARLVWERARAAGIGRELASDWFFEDIKP